MPPATPPGTLVLVVGPSGAGKDTLIDAARDALRDDPRIRFARRVITRPAGPLGEQHEALDDVAFGRLQSSDGLLLSWEAHGLRYGVRAGLAGELAAGRTVVASVSRAVVAEAALRHRVQVAEITAPPALLAARLAARGREDAAAVAARLARTVPLADGVAVARIVNDGTVAEGTAALLAVLRRVADRTAAEAIP